MRIDKERIGKYLDQIAAEIVDLENILSKKDNSLLADPYIIKSLKYSTIVIAEAIASTLQHILAKKFNVVIDGYASVYIQSKENNIIPGKLLTRLNPFFKFRNMLVHQYWRVDNKVFIKNLRDGLNDFRKFIKKINEVVSEGESKNNRMD